MHIYCVYWVKTALRLWLYNKIPHCNYNLKSYITMK